MKKRYLFFGALLLNPLGALSQQVLLEPCDLLDAPVALTDVCRDHPYILVFEDEFDDWYNQKNWGLKWPPGAGYMSPNEPCQEYNTLDNVSPTNEGVVITAKYDPGYRIQAPGNGPNGTTDTYGTDQYLNSRYYAYTSSSLFSNYIFYNGYFEMKCKVPTEWGYWPAFWLYNGTEGLGDPELDIFEMWDNNGTDANLTIHNDGKMCGEMHSTAPVDGWYTFGAYWDDWWIVWMINGETVQVTPKWEVYGSPGWGVTCELVEQYPGLDVLYNKAYPILPMQIAFNLAVRKDDQDPDDPDNPEGPSPNFPGHMEVDYIRFYQQRQHCDEEKTYETTSSLGLDYDVSVMGAWGKPYYHNETGRIINVKGNITVLNHIGSTQLPQQLKLTAAEEFNFNLDPGTGLPVSNSSVIFDIQPGAIFEATIDPNVCYNAPPHMPMNNIQDMLVELQTGGIDNENVLGITDEMGKIQTISISPNPTSGDVITVNSPQKSKVVFMNAQGVKVMEMEVQAGSNQLNVQDLRSGLYHLYFESLKEAVKFVKL